MANDHDTTGAPARKVANDEAFPWFDAAPLQPTAGPARPPTRTATSASEFVAAFTSASGPRAHAFYERFVDRHVVECLRSFMRGATQRVKEGSKAKKGSWSDLRNAAASRSLAQHRLLKRVLEELVALRPRGHQDGARGEDVDRMWPSALGPLQGPQPIEGTPREG